MKEEEGWSGGERGVEWRRKSGGDDDWKNCQKGWIEAASRTFESRYHVFVVVIEDEERSRVWSECHSYHDIT